MRQRVPFTVVPLGRGSRPATDALTRAVAELRAGRMVVVADDHARENEGSVVLAASHVTPEALNFMNRRAGGWVCLALTAERCDELGLKPVAPWSPSLDETPFMVTMQAAEGVSTGISAQDQAVSIRVAIDPARGSDDIVSPGRVQPLRARPGGVLERAGHTEAAVDLARLSGLPPAAVVCELQTEDGGLARRDDLVAFCEEHGLAMVGIDDVIAHRHRTERLVQRVADAALPTRHGRFRVIAYRSSLDDELHVAYVRGEVGGREDVLVRVHTACLTGDVFHSLGCKCRSLLDAALDRIDAEDRGVVVYLSPERREPCVTHVDASPATLRTHGVGAQILTDLGLTSIRVLTNNPKRLVALDGYGLTVTAQLPIEP